MGKLEKSLFIVEQLSGGKRLSLKEINKRLEDTALYDKDILPRTFSRYKDFILMTWGLIIEYDFSAGVYYLENEDYSDQSELYKYLLASIRISNLTAEIMRNRSRIHFSTISTGTENLSPVLTAIETARTIEFDYHSFYNNTLKHHNRFPCFIQEWEGRWYLVAEHQNHSTPTVFAMERMSNVKVGETKGRPSTEINPDTYFAGYFGVDHNLDEPVREVRIRFTDSQVEYVKTKPLHSSQKEIATGSGWSVFSYTVSPTFNFFQQVLWHREKAEIIYPEQTREKMREIVSSMMDLYRQK